MSKKTKASKTGPDERRVGAPRELVESVVIAFVLAFLFRTFEAEAFVIPTGSMASSLMGVHKDVECEACGFQYQIGASQEEDAKDGLAARHHIMSGQEQRKVWSDVAVNTGVCPNCRFPMKLQLPDGNPTFQGDRILVSKFAYQFGEPRRWDVIVFRYPNQSWTNYIKRLVGLPGETIDIRNGDIFVKPPDGDQYTIARKPTDKLMAMARIVHDTNFVPMVNPGKSIYDLGWPARWQAAPDWLELSKKYPENPLAGWGEPSLESGQFQPATDFKSYATDGTSKEMAWLRYRHITPSEGDWNAMLKDQPQTQSANALTDRIDDFLPYNAGKPNVYVDGLGLKLVVRPAPKVEEHWVGDLILEASLDIQDSSGEIMLELVEAGYFFRCVIDVQSGNAELSIESSSSTERSGEVLFDASSDGDPLAFAKAQTPVKGAGKYQVRFANVDDELRLWISQTDAWTEPDPVVFDSPTTYSPLPMKAVADPSTAADDSPVGVGAREVALSASRLRILRDIYYTQPKSSEAKYVANVAIPPGKLFAMGDNSDRSKDSRFFGFVDIERELIGKALYVYWPHAWKTVWPNFERMSFVR
ncbi:MAG: signal peptidase I [Pirellulales bacterium]|nr:signal peptidase I [Pirellulales bacterium]